MINKDEITTYRILVNGLMAELSDEQQSLVKYYKEKLKTLKTDVVEEENLESWFLALVSEWIDTASKI